MSAVQGKNKTARMYETPLFMTWTIVSTKIAKSFVRYEYSYRVQSALVTACTIFAPSCTFVFF